MELVSGWLWTLICISFNRPPKKEENVLIKYLSLAQPRKWNFLCYLQCWPSKTSLLFANSLLPLPQSFKNSLMNHWKFNTFAKNRAHTTEGTTWGYRVHNKLWTYCVTSNTLSLAPAAALALYSKDSFRSSSLSRRTLLVLWYSFRPKSQQKSHVFYMSKYGKDWELYFICYKNKVGGLEKLDTDNQL